MGKHYVQLTRGGGSEIGKSVALTLVTESQHDPEHSLILCSDVTNACSENKENKRC
jgi:hypothetical protein